MKKIIYLFVCIFAISTIKAQTVEGKLTLNERSKTEIKLTSNSLEEVTKHLKSLKISFKANEIEKNQKVTFVIVSVVKRNGETVKKTALKSTPSFFPGDNFIVTSWDDMVTSWDDMVTSWDDMVKKEGDFIVEIQANPKDVKGKIAPVSINFILRKRPGRSK
ncbi:hypothetical protein OD91_1575 [Lutibacter sp. Hel_I_33_5]|uniref:hypothetical protein n=1 Tax=Lutibacter sp. Hel_I_33_5 TaxID=1566289 RepID=UPI0011A30CE1|nr:hypothetical protein [Lutibacter sp. Hel_I_33_5]TVZ56291.1 hypothetical protein OD91_1575 [Lutibacter sp. Hel_I_33_5]